MIERATNDYEAGKFEEAIVALAFSAQGRTLAAGDAGGHVTFWDTQTGHKRTQLYAHHEGVSGLIEGSLSVLADYVGPHKILWATDYPHPDGFFPGAPKMMEGLLKGLSAETKRQVMAGGAMGFYGLN